MNREPSNNFSVYDRLDCNTVNLPDKVLLEAGNDEPKRPVINIIDVLPQQWRCRPQQNGVPSQQQPETVLIVEQKPVTWAVGLDMKPSIW